MNRAMKRSMNKKVRSKLTDEQYKDFRDKAIEEYIQQKIKEGRDRTTSILTESLQEILAKKDYRISEERRNRILEDFIQTLEDKVNKIEEMKGNERLSQC